MIHPFSPPLQALTAAFQDKISVGHPTAPFDIPPILLLMWAPKGAQSHRGVIGRRESARQASGKHSPSARVAFPAALLSSLDRMTHSYQSWRESITHSLARSLTLPPHRPFLVLDALDLFVRPPSSPCISVFQISGIRGRIWGARDARRKSFYILCQPGFLGDVLYVCEQGICAHELRIPE